MATSLTQESRRAGEDSRFGYWLGQCEGFAVLTAHGRVGFVESVRTDASGDCVLVIAGGLFRRRRLLADASDVIELDARRMRVVLGHAPEVVDDPLGGELQEVTE